MKVGDEVWYALTGDPARRWTISSIFNTNTEGLMVCLSRPGETKKSSLERCNALLEDLEEVK